jgi:hypothetical protein
MCIFNVAIDDAVMKDVRPTITEGMEEGAWVQLQVQTLFAKMAEDARNKKRMGYLSLLYYDKRRI